MHRTIEFRRGSFLKGCLIAFAIALVLAVVAGVVVIRKWRSIAVSFAKGPLIAQINSSTLPSEQKTRLTNRIDSFTADWADRKITDEQFGKTMENIAEGPLMPLLLMWGAEKKYLAPSKLTDAEKAEAERSLQRFARGVIEKVIDKVEIKRVMAYIEVPSGGNHQLKNVLTDDELRKFLSEVKAQADKAKVPDEAYTPNIADELDKAIDNGLNGVVPTSK